MIKIPDYFRFGFEILLIYYVFKETGYATALIIFLITVRGEIWDYLRKKN